MWLYDFVLHCNNGNFIAESRLKLKAFKKAFCFSFYFDKMPYVLCIYFDSFLVS